MKTNTVAKRGMVFWFTPPVLSGKTCVQQGHRLWLVTSNDTNNFNASIVNLVPLTTEQKSRLPVHVDDVFINGKRNTILCEQPITTDAHRLEGYVTTLSDEVMKEVDKCIAVQHQLPMEFPLAYSELFRAIDEVAKMHEELNTKIEKVNDLTTTLVHNLNKVEDLHERLVNLIAQNTSMLTAKEVHLQNDNTVKNTIAKLSVNNSTISTLQRDNELAATIIAPSITKGDKTEKSLPDAKKSIFEQQKTIPAGNLESKKPDIEGTKGRTKWTTEKRVEFLRDFDKLSLSQISIKWELSMRSVYTTKYTCLNTLKQQGVDYKSYGKTDGRQDESRTK